VDAKQLKLGCLLRQDLCTMSGPVSTGMGDRVRVQISVRDIYLGM